MSTAIVQVTRKIRVVSAEQVDEDTGLVAPVEDVVEVLGYRSMRLTLRLMGLKGDTPQVCFQMETGMDKDDDGGFVSLGIFDLVGSGPLTLQRTFTDLQRYVRWRIVTMEGSDAEVAFTIDGIAYE